MKFTDFHNSELAEASKTRNATRDFLRNNPVSPDQMAKPVKQMSVPELAAISDEALDNEYHYGRSTPGNTFGWQANLKSAAYAKQLIDKGVTDIEQISDAIHKGWNVTARAFVQNPDQFDDTEKLKAAGKLEAKLQQRAKLMNIEYAQLPDDEQEKDRVVARALLQAIKGQQGVAEGYWADAVKKAEADREARKGKPFEKNPASHDKDGVYIGDKDLAGNPVSKRKEPGVAEARIETIHGSAYTIDPNKYYVWAWDNAVVLYGEYTDENNAELNLSKIERRATKRLGPAVKGRFEVASGKMLLRQYGNEQGVAEAKADPLGAWIAHKNGTEARKFKTREGAKKYVASHAGFTVSSSEAFHDTYRKKKVQEVKKFRTNYGWAGGSKEPQSAHAKQVAAKRKEYDDKGLGKFEPTDNMVGTAKVTKGVAEAQLDEGAVGKLKELYQSLVSKVRTITNFKQYYDAAKLKQQEVVDAIKTSKNAEELKQKIAAIAEPAPVMEEFDPPPATASVAALAVGLFETWAAQVVGVYSQMAVGTGADIVGGLMFGVLGQVGCIGLALYYAIKANQRRKRNQDVAEEYNPEYDDEAGMADNNLSTLRRAVDGLDDLIDTGDNLPEWCQEKIAVAKSMLVTVWNYMESEDDVMAERVEGGGHLKNKDDLRAKRKAIQDILMDPTMDADTLKRAQQAKLDLENQAEKIGVAEGEKWIQKAVNSKTKGNLHKALHVPQDETIPKSRIAQAIHSADPHLRHMAQFAKNVAKEDAGGMGTGSVATSMGAGNGFANGGPGTITRRRK